MNDDATKELDGYLQKISNLGEVAITALKEQIDTEVEEFKNSVLQSILQQHTITGGLAGSFTVEQDTRKSESYYGYRFEFKGKSPRGESYEKIANVLNHGRSATGRTKQRRAALKLGHSYGAIAGTLFVTKAITKLKGMDDRINQAIDKKIRPVLEDN